MTLVQAAMNWSKFAIGRVKIEAYELCSIIICRHEFPYIR